MSKKESAPVVQSASDFAALVSTLMPKAKTILIKETEITRSDDAWSQADAVLGIKNIHMMKSTPNQELLLFTNAQTPVTKPNPAAAMPLDNVEDMQTLKENDWVLVKYDEKTYPGTVTAVVGSEVEVSVMEPAGKFWKWPVKADKIFYTRDNVLQHIDPPEPARTRGQYRFKS